MSKLLGMDSWNLVIAIWQLTYVTCLQIYFAMIKLRPPQAAESSA